MPTLRYFAAVRAAAGVPEDAVEAATVEQALTAVRRIHDTRFAQVLALCSFVVDGDPVGSRDPANVHLTADSTVDCLPPFAGG